MNPFNLLAAVGPGLKMVPGSDILVWVLLEIALIIIVARIVGFLFVKIGQPRVAGEIIAGILLGPSLLGLSLAGQIWPAQPLAVIQRLGDIALLFYMFLVGMELEVRLLRGKEKQIAIVSAAVVVVPLILGFLIAPSLNSPSWKPHGVSMTAFALFIGSGLAVTAFPVMARILQEKRMMSTELGAVGVGSAAVVTLLMFFAIAGASAAGSGRGLTSFKFGGPPYSPAEAVVLTVLFILVLVLIVRPLLARLAAGYDPDHGVRLDFVALIYIGVFVTGVFGDRIGITQWVGSFLFGVVVPTQPGLRREISNSMEKMVSLLLLPIFLAFSGIKTNLRLLTPSLIPGLVLFLVMMIVGKLLVGALTGRAVGLKWKQAGLMGVLLNCRGLLILAVAIIGLQLGVITPQMQVVFVIGAIVTTMMTGPLVDALAEPEAATPSAATIVPPEQAAALALAPSGVRRILVAIGNPANAPELVRAGRALGGVDAPLELLLVRLIPLPEAQEFRRGPSDLELDVARSLKELRALADLIRGQGVSAIPLAFQSPDIAGDLIRLSSDLGVDTLLMGWARPSIAQETVAALARRLYEEARCSVAVLVDRGGTDIAAAGGSPVLVIGDAVRPAAERIAAVLKTNVRPASPDEIDRQPAAAIVAARAATGRVFGAGVDELVERSDAPVFVIRPARVPGTARPAGQTALPAP